MSILLVIIHVIACVAIIMVVLLQTGKGADIGAAFGGGGSQTLFGSSGASTFLSKATTVIAIVFMITSLSLAYMSGNRNKRSIMKNIKIPVAVEQKAAQSSDVVPEEQTAPAALPDTGEKK
ncbi:MAG: preprotein translocase subunit SecG [Desulfobacterium sp.]|nr:preprotein translocase subunit SecG [Desulfobacterium sp.]MBU3948732.1 preprotein translocase subunit SecG [Pseudomonadota bacterium]MBU4037468.1 preprotein translocase subunit SecG [Pseudomonadota bacterium]